MNSEFTEDASVEVEIVTDTAEDEGEIYDLEDNDPDDDEVMPFIFNKMSTEPKGLDPWNNQQRISKITTQQSKINPPMKNPLSNATFVILQQKLRRTLICTRKPNIKKSHQ